MSQQLMIETGEMGVFITARCLNSRLWFVNDRELGELFLGQLAKLQERYRVKIYAFTIQGNHLHLLAQFPEGRKGDFKRDFFSMVAKLTNSKVKGREEGGILFGRRGADQFVPLTKEDVLDRFLYCALNPTLAGLVKHPDEYNSYSSFNDSLRGMKRKFRLVEWSKYNNRKRHNENLRPDDFEVEYELVYSKLPGCEELSQDEYNRFLSQAFEERRKVAVAKREATGSRYPNPKKLRRTKAGAKPKTTKKSSRDSYRPIVLTVCAETRARIKDWYFRIRESYKAASFALRKLGATDVTFPLGTYPPHRRYTELATLNI